MRSLGLFKRAEIGIVENMVRVIPVLVGSRILHFVFVGTFLRGDVRVADFSGVDGLKKC